jgi:predicted RNA-binding protein with PUA-like domain
MGYSSVFFAEYRDAAEFDPEASYLDHNYTKPSPRIIQEVDAMFAREAKRKAEDDALKWLEDAEDAVRIANAFNQLEVNKLRHELKYYRGDNPEKFFALKVHIKTLSERLRA